MIEIGRLCVKISGRDANKKCIIIEQIDNNYVMIDGETRRKKVNINHLEPTKTKIEIKKGASRADVVKEFKKLKIELKETKPKKAADKQVKKRKIKKNSKEVKKKKTKK